MWLITNQHTLLFAPKPKIIIEVNLLELRVLQILCQNQIPKKSSLYHHRVSLVDVSLEKQLNIVRHKYCYVSSKYW